MARTPPEYAQLIDEPTIIVDPALFLPPPRTALAVVRDVCFGVARGIVVAALAGATVFSVAHVLKHQTLTHGLHAQTMEPVIVRVQAARAAPEEEHARPGVLPRNAELAAVHTDIAQVSEPLAQHPNMLMEERLDLKAPAEASANAEATTRSDLMDLVRDGRRLLRTRRYDDAEAAFRLVLEQRANQPAALSGLARVKLARGHIDEARQYAERAVQIAPYQASYHFVLADVLRAGGDTVASQTEFELAAKLSPSKKGDEAERVLPPNPF